MGGNSLTVPRPQNVQSQVNHTKTKCQLHFPPNKQTGNLHLPFMLTTGIIFLFLETKMIY